SAPAPALGASARSSRPADPSSRRRQTQPSPPPSPPRSVVSPSPYHLPCQNYTVATRLKRRTATVCSCTTNPLLSSCDYRRLSHVVLLLPVTNRRPNRVFCEHRAVDLHRRKRQLLHNVRVRDRHCLVDRLALNPLCRER